MDPAPPSTRIEALGDAALLIHFGERIDPLVNAHVLASAERLRAAAWPGILDLIPAYAMLTVCYDPGEWLAAQLRERLARLLSARCRPGRRPSRTHSRRGSATSSPMARCTTGPPWSARWRMRSRARRSGYAAGGRSGSAVNLSAT